MMNAPANLAQTVRQFWGKHSLPSHQDMLLCDIFLLSSMKGNKTSENN
jgi:hypothetical protein